MKKVNLIAIMVVIAVISGVVGWTIHTNKALGLATSQFTNNAADLIGTKTGTTTAGVNFGVAAASGRSATSSYISKIGGPIDQAFYTFKVLQASSSADLLFSWEASNDDYCDTASSTTSIADMVLTGDVNWFSIPNNFTNKVHATSLNNASSTLQWSNPIKNAGTTVALDNLNYECLKLSVSGSSTVLWSQIRTK